MENKTVQEEWRVNKNQKLYLNLVCSILILRKIMITETHKPTNFDQLIKG